MANHVRVWGLGFRGVFLLFLEEALDKGSLPSI